MSLDEWTDEVVQVSLKDHIVLLHVLLTTNHSLFFGIYDHFPKQIKYLE